MDGSVVIGTDLDTTGFDAQIEYVKSKLEEINDQLNKADMGYEVGDTMKLEAEYEKLSNKLRTLISKKEEFNNIKFTEIRANIDKVGKSVDSVAKKTSRLILGIFGIRSAYMFVSQSMSTLSQYDNKMAMDIQYIRYLLASTLKPVVEYIVQLAYKLLGVINYIAGSLFSVNLFANASTEAFLKQSKALGGSAKSAKDLKKTLTGWDEMTVLQDTDTGSGGASAGVGDWEPPDLSKGEEQVKEIENKWRSIGDILRKYVEEAPWEAWIKAFGLWGISIKGVTEFVYGLWNVLTGVFDFIKGIVETIVGLITGNTELVDKGIKDMVKGLSEFLTGILYTFIGMIHEWVGIVLGIGSEFISSLIKICKDLGIWIGDFIYSIYEWIRDTGTGITDWLTNLFTGFGNWIGDRISDLIDFIKTIPGRIKQVFKSLVSWFGGLWNRIVSTFKSFGISAGNAVGSAFKSVINGALGVVEGVLNAPINAINKLSNVINKIPGVNIGRLNTFRFPRLAKGGIINMPGRGVPVGNAIAGERGQEGVIPLTDSQQMALLGEMIGRYVTINANITNTMNGRVISRELKRIQNDNDFAYNR